MEVREQLEWGIASTPKTQNSEQHFKDKTKSFLNFKLQIIRLAQ